MLPVLRKILSSFNCGLDGKLNDAATQLDPLDRDGGMLDNLARNGFEFCFCGWQPHQTPRVIQPGNAFGQVAMTGKYAPPEVTIRSYPDSPICDVVVVVRGQEMVLRCRDYRQAMRWARLERKSYKIPEPDIDLATKAESGDLPLFLRSDNRD